MLAIYKEYYCSFCFVGQLLKMFYLRLNLKKPDFDSFLIVKMLKIHNFNARAIIDSETESFTEGPIHEYFAQRRFHFVALHAYAFSPVALTLFRNYGCLIFSDICFYP